MPRSGLVWSIAARPDADINGIDGFAIRQRVLGQQLLKGSVIDLVNCQRIIEAAPLALMLWLAWSGMAAKGPAQW
jgi:hypothetical protein